MDTWRSTLRRLGFSLAGLLVVDRRATESLVTPSNGGISTGAHWLALGSLVILATMGGQAARGQWRAEGAEGVRGMLGGKWRCIPVGWDELVV